MPLVLSRAQVRELLDMPSTIGAVERALVEFSTGRANMPVRVTTHIAPHAGIALGMPAYLADTDALATKIVTVYKNNPARGLPTIMAVVVLSDPTTGQVTAIMDGGYLTAVRTAAASAVGTKYLATPGPKTVGIVGVGAQGAAHVAAMRAVADVRRVIVHSRSSENSRAFADRESTPECPCTVAESTEQVCRESDIVVLVTTAAEPIVRRAWFRPGTHINAVGSHSPGARELDSDTVAASRVVVDSRAANLVECGDLLVPMQEGRIDRTHFEDEIGEVAAGQKAGRRSAAEITIFKSVGIAVEDVAAANLVYRRARERGVGTAVEI